MKFVAAFFLTLFLVIIYMANTGQEQLLFQIRNVVPHGDKVGHVVIYGGLTLLVNYMVGFRHFANKLLLQHGSLVVLGFSFIEECSQYFIATRTFSMMDMLANLIGIILFTLVSIVFAKFAFKANNT